MKQIVVCGSGGFIGGHLVTRLKNDGHWVRGVDIKEHEFHDSDADDFIVGDLRNIAIAAEAVSGMDVVYQLAADMGGAGYIFSGEHDANIMHNSGLINHNVLEASRIAGVSGLFWSSSACIYPSTIQATADAPALKESDAYPANPDSDYGWEKLFSERMYLAYARNYEMNIRVARFHNIYGPLGSYRGGREKAPAAICRKVIEAQRTGNHEIEIWGDGHQVRSFCWIGDCVEGIVRLMASDFRQPLNIGSSESVTVNQLLDLVEEIADVKLRRTYKLDAPKGVAGRNSDNTLIRQTLGWEPKTPLKEGLAKTYAWIKDQYS